MVQEGHFQIHGAITFQFSVTYYSSLEDGEKWNSLFSLNIKWKQMTLRSLKKIQFFPWGFYSPNIFKDNIHSRAGLHLTGLCINPGQYNM